MKVAGVINGGKHGAEIAKEINNICVCGTYQRMKKAVAGL
jgi:aerobic-type carbon monoxide dehydrogenase small subunit (CoxS/CutS family)